MSFCVKCGAKQEENAKFCNSCGHQIGAPAPAPAPTPAVQPTYQAPPAAPQAAYAAAQPPTANTAPTGALRKELLQLSNSFFACYLISFFLMKVQSAGGFKSATNEFDDVGTMLIVYFIFMAVIIGITYFTVRVQAVNKGKGGWALGTAIVLALLIVFGWTSTNFAIFNWADWASQGVDIAQAVIAFLIYQAINKATSAQG